MIWGMARHPSLFPLKMSFSFIQFQSQVFLRAICAIYATSIFFVQIGIFRSTYMCVIWYRCKLWHLNCFLPAYGINQSGVNNSLLFQLCLRFPLLYFLLPFLHSWMWWCVKYQSPKRQQLKIVVVQVWDDAYIAYTC